MTDPGQPEDLVRFIARYGTAAKILAEHRPDSEGRCPTCRSAGASSGRVKAPCPLYSAALAAANVDQHGPEGTTGDLTEREY